MSKLYHENLNGLSFLLRLNVPQPFGVNVLFVTMRIDISNLFLFVTIIICNSCDMFKPLIPYEQKNIKNTHTHTKSRSLCARCDVFYMTFHGNGILFSACLLCELMCKTMRHAWYHQFQFQSLAIKIKRAFKHN